MAAEVFIHPAAYADMAGILRQVAQADKPRAAALLAELSEALLSAGGLLRASTPILDDDDLRRMGYRYAVIDLVTVYFREGYLPPGAAAAPAAALLVQRVLPGRRKTELLLR